MGHSVWPPVAFHWDAPADKAGGSVWTWCKYKWSPVNTDASAVCGECKATCRIMDADECTAHSVTTSGTDKSCLDLCMFGASPPWRVRLCGLWSTDLTAFWPRSSVPGCSVAASAAAAAASLLAKLTGCHRPWNHRDYQRVYTHEIFSLNVATVQKHYAKRTPVGRDRDVFLYFTWIL